MNIIKTLSLLELQGIYNKLKTIKSNLQNNQKLIITLDTETTGKYYNKFQIENTGVDIVDKIVEFGAIFSIENIDNKGFKTIIPIIENDIDYGFRIFFNPFIDGHKPFHLKMPDEPFKIHGISLDFLEGNGRIEISNETLEEPAPSLLNNYEIDNEIKTSYIKEIIYIINACDILIAHNATFDIGMINEAINDHNKIEGNERLPYCSCQVLDTLKLFKDVFPKEKLIAMQEENEPNNINHRLDNLMYLADIQARDVHGAYWDSKLLIDSYNVILEKYLKYDYMQDIVNKQSKYLSQIEYKNMKSFQEEIEELFFEKLHNENFLDQEKIKLHLKLQLNNINKQKRNLITEDLIENSVLYYKAFLGLNKNIDDMIKFEEKVNKMTSRTYQRMLKELKESKVFSVEEIMSVKENDMSHYLTQAVYYYFKFKFEKEVLKPLLVEKFELLNNIIESKKDEVIEIDKDLVYSYFRTDGSIATKDNSLTTIIGSVSNVKKYFSDCNVNRVICMDFNSMVNYINVGKYLKAYNDTTENKIDLSYGLTTLLKLNLNDELRNKYNITLDFIEFEINIICKNEKGIRLLPQILKSCYTDKFKDEESYKNPYLSLEQFNELNKNENLVITLGSYKGLVERVLFDLDIQNLLTECNKQFVACKKTELIYDLISMFETRVNIEIYPCDPFLLDFKKHIINVDYICTNPTIYLEGDYEYHTIRCYKYNDNVYKLNNLGIFDNFKLKTI